MNESEWYDSGQLVPDQVTPASDELPIVNGTAAARYSTSYSRGDHVHPQQLTYDNDITATKFIMTGGTNQQILLANGDTTTIDSKISRTYSSGSGGYIRLCVFPTGTSTAIPYIQFQVTCNTNSMQTIDLAPYYTVNGIIDLFGKITAPQYVQTNYNIYDGVDQLLHTHTGSYSSAVHTAWIHMMTGSGSVTVTVVNKAPVGLLELLRYQHRILSRQLVDHKHRYQFHIVQVMETAINTTQTGQWEISKTNDNTLYINLSSLRQADHSVGLNIISDSSTIKFNGNELVNVGTDQTITGRKTFAGVTTGNMQINPTATSYDDGLRIARLGDNSGNSSIQLGCSRTSITGAVIGQWSIFTPPNTAINNPQSLVIAIASQAGDNTRGLQISADGNTLTFNGRVL
ncbi:MAG: hypothetical protein EZS28_022987 [Streblomastix strix]|uniref:Uncharacterized protein n=1 Tax=Streblomastix strix TaxID=222440 RepID=A0A5J4VGL6_9EUKA|nr:MAG: hypothetical protein EZS28_022987 [Streblomastix strix]